MKRLIPYFVTLLLLLSGTAAAQSNSQALTPARKAITIFGTVSNDGKTLLSTNSRAWSITNPGLLAGSEGHRVKIKCRVYADTSNIVVIAVKLTDVQTQYAANKGDSAFRR
jgi:hypothetical protein